MNDHEHRYYLAGKTYTEFTDCGQMALQGEMQTVYQRTEYAVLSCNCGSVLRKVVKDD